MNIEGEFRFTNGAAIDTGLSEDRIASVINHEYAHNQLYSSTTYGQVILMLEKNEIIHEKSKLFKSVLFQYMNRMQERTAVNIEVIRECLKNGLTGYEAAIEKLKERNRNYYNYFRKLCCLNGKVNSQQDAEQIINILMRTATIALNVNPELIPFDKISNSKDLKAYFDNPDHGALISPNKRFDILINFFFRNNDNNNDIESVIRGSIDIEKMFDYQYIHSVALKSMRYVIRDSHIFERLEKRLETVGVLQFVLDGGEYLSIKPAKLNENNTVNLCPINSKEEFYEKVVELETKEVFVQHNMGGFEDIHIITIYSYEDDKKTVFALTLSGDNQLFKILTKLPCNIVFNKTKLIDREGKSIRKMLRKLPVYMYMDTPILPALPFIESFFCKGKYGFIELNSYSIFVAYKRSFLFFADIVDEAKEAINHYLANKNIEYVEDLNDICDVSEICRIDEECAQFELSKPEDLKLQS